MKKTIANFFIAVLTVFVVSNTANAYDFQVDNFYYNIVSFEEMTCAITHSGEEYSGDVIIPVSVTYNGRILSVVSIGSYAFQHCRGLTSVTIPNSVTEIGSSAFGNCSSLTSVTIPNSVTEIGSSAFNGCSSLASIVIGNSVTEIGSYAFEGCSSLASIVIGNSVTEIGSYAFRNCSSLASIVIGNSVTEIGSYAFRNCSSLTSVTIPNSVTEIGSSAFGNCSSLASVTFEDGTTSLNTSKAFYNTNITYLYVGRQIYFNSSIPLNKGATLEIGNNVESIPKGSISYMYNISLLISRNLLPPAIPPFSNAQYLDIEVRVPAEALDAYRQADVWKLFWNLKAIDTSGINETTECNAVSIRIENSTIIAENLNQDAPLEVYTIEGQNVYSGNGREVSDLSAGIYIVRAGNKSIKVAIQ